MGWYEDRFTPSASKVEDPCTVCGRLRWFPASKAAKYPRCSKACSDAHTNAVRASRTRTCEACGKSFVARPWQIRVGGAKLCSRACTVAAMAVSRTPESYARAAETRKATVKAGDYVIPAGESHPRWRGGRKAAERRAVKSGKKAAGTRRYRAENPHKVREFTQRRQGRKIGRLPRGTIANQGSAQSWLCFICSADITGAFHVDHWMPLALGGEHQPQNIRLLCPTCNVRKGAKHPDAFLAEIAA